jgi:hypothetical protein
MKALSGGEKKTNAFIAERASQFLECNKINLVKFRAFRIVPCVQDLRSHFHIGH